ncbi:BhlA/UviB family holin-like peptide [Heyndrickxia sp. FSL K6-6286]|uniref:BhlA/UviB family holin-like peptide n=1 Tax=Heyndrickxia oleronia TaxID=38875 RepID=A0AAW6SM34_9BACI|nr:BhlA/UviB family holin-like peptide [Heyndrickxia oleronia]MDH5159805.1 BhlA/UviB family holin-like peptide [Heyndrickxia oleronia]NYV68945.1 hypothetical protein [Bacillus sp. Gen3]
MEDKFVEYFIANGPFAVLFVGLLIFVMRTNKEREARQEETNKEREGRLHELLDKFSDKYDVVIEELRDIKNKIGGGGKE